MYVYTLRRLRVEADGTSLDHLLKESALSEVIAGLRRLGLHDLADAETVMQAGEQEGDECRRLHHRLGDNFLYDNASSTLGLVPVASLASLLDLVRRTTIIPCIPNNDVGSVVWPPSDEVSVM
jgi:hypothetical protein